MMKEMRQKKKINHQPTKINKMKKKKKRRK